MEWMFVLLTTICHIYPLCHTFIATLHLGLLDCHNNTRKCYDSTSFSTEINRHAVHPGHVERKRTV